MTGDADAELAAGRKRLGAALRARREDAGLTRRRMSEMTGVGYDSLFSIEAGRRLPNLSTLFKISRALETTPRELLAGIDPWDAAPASSE